MVAFNQNELKSESNGVERSGNLNFWQHLGSKIFNRNADNIGCQTGTKNADAVQFGEGNSATIHSTNSVSKSPKGEFCKECTYKRQLFHRNDRWDLFKKTLNMFIIIVSWACILLTFCLIWGLYTNHWETWERFSEFVLDLIKLFPFLM